MCTVDRMSWAGLVSGSPEDQGKEKPLLPLETKVSQAAGKVVEEQPVPERLSPKEARIARLAALRQKVDGEKESRQKEKEQEDREGLRRAERQLFIKSVERDSFMDRSGCNFREARALLEKEEEKTFKHDPDMQRQMLGLVRFKDGREWAEVEKKVGEEQQKDWELSDARLAQQVAAHSFSVLADRFLVGSFEYSCAFIDGRWLRGRYDQHMNPRSPFKIVFEGSRRESNRTYFIPGSLKDLRLDDVSHGDCGLFEYGVMPDRSDDTKSFCYHRYFNSSEVARRLGLREERWSLAAKKMIELVKGCGELELFCEDEKGFGRIFLSKPRKVVVIQDYAERSLTMVAYPAIAEAAGLPKC